MHSYIMYKKLLFLTDEQIICSSVFNAANLVSLHVIFPPAQIKMFLMKSESSLILHRQQHNWNVPRPRNVVIYR